MTKGLKLPGEGESPVRQSIALRDLRRATERSGVVGEAGRDGLQDVGHNRSRSPSPIPMAANLPGLSMYWEHAYVPGSVPASAGREDRGEGAGLDRTVLQSAVPPGEEVPQYPASLPGRTYSIPCPYEDGEGVESDSVESDRVPLRPSAQSIGRLGAPEAGAARRDSFQTVSDLSPSPGWRKRHMLGHDLEAGLGLDPSRSLGATLSPAGTRSSRAGSASGGALHRAGSMMKAVSQRVVMIGGEGELGEELRDRSPSLSHSRSRSRSRSRARARSHSRSRDGSQVKLQTSNHLDAYPLPPLPSMEKRRVMSECLASEEPASPLRMRNPLRGKSLGIFPAENVLRRWLCDLLVNSWTEPVILVLIVLQTILLAIESAPDVFQPENRRPDGWGSTSIDWALFGLFVVFTIELMGRIIVSGLVINAAEYDPTASSRRIKERVAEQYRTIFQPQRQRQGQGNDQGNGQEVDPQPFLPSTFGRSFTIMQPGHGDAGTVEEQQRLQLARRAFLRHSFNRLDFIAVVSFWISFVLGVSGLESGYRLYVFRMLSCLRIIRLLALTKGNLIILRSLKKSAPLLVRVSFLMGFFWLLFAIIGVQSFKSSLSRQCTWIDPAEPGRLDKAYSPPGSFCGGYLAENGSEMAWVRSRSGESLADLVAGAARSKGFLCPKGSICLQRENPYGGTVKFDDIGHSLELVFVIMSANTWSDLMYNTIRSDYLQAALFFGAGIMIMMLWMTNLLIAVITSSFQVIREESKASTFTADEEQSRGPTAQGPESGQESGQQHGQQQQQQQQQKQPDDDEQPRPLKRLYDKTRTVWILVIAYGLVCQALRSGSMSPARSRFVDGSEAVVTLLLAAEVAVRYAGDVRSFYRHKTNLFDLGLALTTCVMLLPPIRHSGQVYNWLTVFQIVRVYRVVMAMPMTRDLIVLVLGNVTGIGNLMSFVFLITFLMSIFASQLFRGEIPAQDEDGAEIRIPFNTIFNSFLGMYQILSSENWTEVLYSVTTYTTRAHTAWIGAVFLIGWFILAYFVLVNMFIAVIQENFDVGEDRKRLEQVKAFLQPKEPGSSNLSLSKVFRLGRSEKRKDPLDCGPATMEMLLKEAVVREFLDDEETAEMAETRGTRETRETGQPEEEDEQDEDSSRFRQPDRAHVISPVRRKLTWLLTSQEANPFYATDFRRSETLDPRQMARQAVSASAARRKAQREYLERHPTYNTTLFLFRPTNPIRRLCQRLVGPSRGLERFEGVDPNRYAWYTFSALIYAAIVAMVVIACVSTPLYQKEHAARQNNWFVWADVCFAVIFTLEAVIKLIADGLFWTPNAYLGSMWGIIDGVVLVTLWINIITVFTSDEVVSRAVGAFKALRALRLLNVSDRARDTFQSLIIISGWKVISAALVSLSLLIPFALYGLNLFSGKLVACNDVSGAVLELDNCLGEYESRPYRADWPLLAPRVASNPYFNFDDFGSSLFILFQIVSQEGWVDVSFATQAINGRGRQPQASAPYRNQGNALFFVVFNLLSTVFVLTLFISVFMRNYTEQTGVAFLTAEQRSWLELRKLLRHISPSRSAYDESTGPVKRWCHKRAIEKRGRWYKAITGVLVCHLMLLLTEFYGEPTWWARTRDYLFLLFTSLYLGNVIIRIIGLGWARFRKSSWDVFSLLVVLGDLATSVFFLLLERDLKRDEDTYNQLHKFFLVATVLLLIPRNDALDQLFKTAAASLTTIGNLLATWLVFFLVFAIAMTQEFSLTRFGPGESGTVNFRTVPNALILLFRFSVGEGWNQVMEDLAGIRPPLCVEGPTFADGDCGSTSWARILLVAWNIVSMYLFVNLFVSLIYESFSYVYQRTSNGLAVVDRDEIRRFKEAWRLLDPHGSGFISKEDFPRLLGELSGVFEMRIYPQEDSVRSILEDVRVGGGGCGGGGMPEISGRHLAVGSQGIDLARLNARVARIDVDRVRQRRRRFHIFFEEVMVSADPEKGIFFTTVLMILAHYNIISDNKSLRLEEFLRRRARIQRVEEEVRRRVVLGFFDMIYYSRRFRRHLERKRSGRMTAVPQLGVPEILVEDDEEGSSQLDDKTAGSGTSGSATWAAAAPAATRGRAQSSGSADVVAPRDAWHGHPLAGMRTPISSVSPATSTAKSTPGKHNESYSFDIQTPLPPPPPQSGRFSENAVWQGYDCAHDPAERHSYSRRRSGVSPAEVRDMLDGSEWMASIRRSKTVRMPGSNRSSLNARTSSTARWSGGEGALF